MVYIQLGDGGGDDEKECFYAIILEVVVDLVAD